ncbi:unnamed protein product [Protopolystoma xenopodis]|uniref:Uncharacterized protein n=1 Tax=Protopolystoma xenopodis TaxID=117903 RepID=A0A3S5AH46_9PLAT|nr:unnamed protein product [Protopolystoma xenopodis]
MAKLVGQNENIEHCSRHFCKMVPKLMLLPASQAVGRQMGLANLVRKSSFSLAWHTLLEIAINLKKILNPFLTVSSALNRTNSCHGSHGHVPVVMFMTLSRCHDMPWPTIQTTFASQEHRL